MIKGFPYSITLAIAVSLQLISCGNSAKENSETSTQVQDGAVVYGQQNASIPPLSPEAQPFIVQWSVFEDLESDLRSINGATREKIRSVSERLVIYSDSLSKKIPDTLNNKAIVSRLTVLNTRTNLLFQEAHKSRIDSLKLELALTELNRAATNMVVQINEKFQKDAIDIQRKDDEDTELQQQKRFTDSVYKVERKDISDN